MSSMTRSDKNNKLIAAVRRNELLWNTDSESFKDTEQKKLVWERIGEDLDLDAQFCKTRWRNLRDVFVKQLRTSKRGPYWDQLEFLRPLYNSERIKKNMENDMPRVNEIQLLNEVRKHPALYDLDHPHNKYRIKEQIWAEIGQLFHVDRDVCKTQWKYLKDAYRKKRRQKVTQWIYAEHLSFLEDVRWFVKPLEEDDSDLHDSLNIINPLSSINLIVLVKKYEILYNPALEDFNDEHKTDLAWKKVANMMRHDVNSCKERWEELCNIHKKYREKKVSGSPTSQKTAWKYAENMSFLDDYPEYWDHLTNTEDFINFENEEVIHLNISALPTLAIEDLIEEIKKYDIIYNPDLPEFYDFNEKDLIWQDIAEILDTKAETCKTLWETVYNAYRMTRKNPDAEHNEWSKYAPQLEFLDAYFDNEGESDDEDISNLGVWQIKLIQEVQKRPMLYDANLPEFKDVDRKDIEWEHISEILKSNANTCKTKWKNIRDTYRKYKKTKNTKSTKYRFADLLKFLDKTFSKTIPTDDDDVKAENARDNDFIQKTLFCKKLIKEVRKNKVIYAELEKGQKHLKIEAWQNVSEALNVDVPTCKKKWSDLRSAHRMYYEASPRRDWKFAHELRFLDDTVKRRLTGIEFVDMNSKKKLSNSNSTLKETNFKIISPKKILKEESVSDDDDDDEDYVNDIDIDDMDDVDDDENISMELADLQSPKHKNEYDYDHETIENFFTLYDPDVDEDITMVKTETGKVEITRTEKQMATATPTPTTPQHKPQTTTATDNISKSSTDLLLDSLKLVIRKANLTIDQTIELDHTISNVIYTKLTKFKKLQSS